MEIGSYKCSKVTKLDFVKKSLLGRNGSFSGPKYLFIFYSKMAHYNFFEFFCMQKKLKQVYYLDKILFAQNGEKGAFLDQKFGLNSLNKKPLDQICLISHAGFKLSVSRNAIHFSILAIPQNPQNARKLHPESQKKIQPLLFCNSLIFC